MPTTETPNTLSREAVRGMFEGNIPPVVVPVHYRAGLFLVAVAMVLLPLVYVSLIALVGWAVCWHALHNTTIFDTRGSGIFILIVYFGPMVIGGLLILFMIKPLFARRARAAQPRVLSAEQEPVLFAFVERVCECVGAPMPSEIRVDCQVNASAAFRRGLGSFFANDLVLTIGLPLAAGMSVREFAGVLAHEFGHFAQAAGMRMTYVIRSVNLWFARVVYERDEWDEKLAEASRRIDFRVGIVLYTARFFIWLTRKLLWALMNVGHWISCYMLRQMEFDADRYETLLAGSRTFAGTVERLQVLNLAMRMAFGDLSQAYAEGRLADNLPGLALARVAELPAENVEQLRKQVVESKTGKFDTHPVDSDRIANANRTGGDGLFGRSAEAELPARVLFADFDSQSRQVSADYYGEVLGAEFKKVKLVALAEVLERSGRERARQEALGRFWQNQFSVLRPVVLAKLPATAAGGAELEVAREKMLSSVERYRQAYASFDKADSEMLEGMQTDALRLAGFKVNAKTTAQPLATAEMEAFEAAGRERLAVALGLLESAEVRERMPDGAKLREDAVRLVAATAVVGALLPELLVFRNEYAQLMVLMQQLPKNQENQELIEAVRSRMTGVRQRLDALRSGLGDAAYPFDHARAGMTMREFVFPEFPAADDLGALARTGQDAMNRLLYGLYTRGMGELAVIAEKVETACGFPSFPKPAEPLQAR